MRFPRLLTFLFCSFLSASTWIIMIFISKAKTYTVGWSFYCAQWYVRSFSDQLPTTPVCSNVPFSQFSSSIYIGYPSGASTFWVFRDAVLLSSTDLGKIHRVIKFSFNSFRHLKCLRTVCRSGFLMGNLAMVDSSLHWKPSSRQNKTKAEGTCFAVSFSSGC